MTIPAYERPSHDRLLVDSSQTIDIDELVRFLHFVVQDGDLGVADYLDQMSHEPFFLVAATGLGKTVAVPIHELIRQLQRSGQQPTPHPRVWVVEPTLPIADDQVTYMNGLWGRYRRRTAPQLYGSKTSKGERHADAPIQFVTTGVFGLLARKGTLQADHDRVLIDEAHVTIEQSSDVELGIALCWAAGVTVDYMSATVDTTGLGAALRVQNIIEADRARFPIWKHNLGERIDAQLADLIKNTLISPNPASRYFPQPGTYANADSVRQGVLEGDRSHGMLVVVNSFAGQQSDTRRLADLIHRDHPTLPVLQLASEVIRDPKREEAFRHELAGIEQQRANYVIIATSVIEMGVTFPTLDYVVTMDSGFVQETIGDTTFPVVAPLGVNSLLQRIGRVGRIRPGIAYISREVGAEYSLLDDDTLNGGGLTREKISFPLTSGPLMQLAYYTCKQGWRDLDSEVRDLGLPSQLHANADRMEYLREQIQLLEALELSKDHQLTPLGQRMDRWIGRVDLAYAVTLQRRFEGGAELPELIFWVVATALSSTRIVQLRARYDYFVDYHHERSTIAHAVELFKGNIHEDIAAFRAILWLAEVTPWLSMPSKATGRHIDEQDRFELRSFCNVVGLDSQSFLRAGKAIADIWRIFGRVNGRSDRVTQLFGTNGLPDIAALPWHSIGEQLPLEQLQEELETLPGCTRIEFSPTDTAGRYEWRDLDHGHCGELVQDDTPIEIKTSQGYIARVVPARDSQGSETTWRLAHLGMTVLAASSSTTVGSRVSETQLGSPQDREHLLPLKVTDHRAAARLAAPRAPAAPSVPTTPSRPAKATPGTHPQPEPDTATAANTPPMRLPEQPQPTTPPPPPAPSSIRRGPTPLVTGRHGKRTRGTVAGVLVLLAVVGLVLWGIQRIVASNTEEAQQKAEAIAAQRITWRAPSIAGNEKVRWSSTAQPATLTADRLYRAAELDQGGQTISAIDTTSGVQLWQYITPTENVAINPIAPLLSANVIISKTALRFYALDATSGALLWQSEWSSGSEGDVAVSGTTVATRDSANRLHGYDIHSGNELWTITQVEPFASAVTISASNGVIVALADDTLTGFKASNGRRLWRLDISPDTAGNSEFPNMVGTSGDRVVVRTTSWVAAYALGNGAEQWRTEFTSNATDTALLTEKFVVAYGCVAPCRFGSETREGVIDIQSGQLLREGPSQVSDGSNPQAWLGDSILVHWTEIGGERTVETVDAATGTVLDTRVFVDMRPEFVLADVRFLYVIDYDSTVVAALR